MVGRRGPCNSPWIDCGCPPTSRKPNSKKNYVLRVPEEAHPPANSTFRELLERWASILEILGIYIQGKLMTFNGRLFVSENADRLEELFNSQGHRVLRMVDLYSKQIRTTMSAEFVEIFGKLIGMEEEVPGQPSPCTLYNYGTFDKSIREALVEELGCAVRALFSGDWSVITKMGVMLLQNSFQATVNPADLPPDLERDLTFIFQSGI